MKAIIRIDVPEYQIGQEVSCYFKDTMNVKGICEAERTGHWLKANPFLLAECSECGNKALGNHGFDEVLTDYCPNCGAKMEGETHDR